MRLAGPALGAVALAASASLASGLPFVIVRDEAKGYGTENRIEGPFEPGELVCLIEDVVTSGGALAEAVAALREAGLEVRNAVCVVDREEGGADALARIGVRLRAALRCRRTALRAKNRRKPAWLSQSDAAVRVPARVSASSHEQEEWQVTKQEFVDAVASKSNLSRRDAAPRWTRCSRA